MHTHYPTRTLIHKRRLFWLFSWSPSVSQVVTPASMSHACSHAVSAFLRTSDRKIGRWNQQVLASPTGCFHWTSGRDRYFFHESVDHRGLRGAIPYTRCLCDAWDKLQDNASNQGMKKQGGRGGQFTEHRCETEHENRSGSFY